MTWDADRRSIGEGSQESGRHQQVRRGLTEAVQLLFGKLTPLAEKLNVSPELAWLVVPDVSVRVAEVDGLVVPPTAPPMPLPATALPGPIK